ncbi:hypothetical protein A3G63_01220 [Candidatus Kaiserbacteria bacterium RIFCSPLOWO2_12_FULL_52_8]|uniref:DUF642 domain-containing protein n=1 Tax=Candidatus Kaiserbacteria bacterium RIFCSPHIGHO2_01_FULL_53_31 TaxID=1798481 RepID=A0A1F6CGV8_9BACT|nr:MAG: hypothetical protein A2678_01735 [Candidatus Kaiserbacteria bacterium RIFCSPHIGHO2_01_FULL_53_31]OGG93619.1 MAG: hypothetical protein A3G63_01220 [Candidatus Kaiserbacteria bacterium RIFCSPLOWO2_12_FULL_52_8]
MKRILLSLAIVTLAGSVAALGSTGAFFSDTETSLGNTFTAGAIDLKIDNTSYYNGAATSGTSWDLRDLTIEKFFNFLDLKPGDLGEDTISLHVNTNDAYVCANVKLTSNDDNGLNEPEALVDTTDGPGNGELAQNVNFIWWADDGDNVLESDETVISQGPLSNIGAVGDSVNVTLADTNTNIWGSPGPLPGNTDKFIGKAWCFGTIASAALAQDSLGPASPRTPANSTGGISCNGSGLNNSTQTDSLTADVTFTATQARNNSDFVCAGNCAFDSTANLVVDGGFENPEVTSGDKWDIFPSPAGGWNVLWRDPPPGSPPGRPATANIELHEGVLGAAAEGDQYTELDSDWNGHVGPLNNEPASTVIYQDIPTQIGAAYSLTYQFAARPSTVAANNRLESRLGGIVMDDTGGVADPNAGITWIAKGPFPFVATTTTTRVQFTDLGTADSLGTFLDDVKLSQTSCVN